jgi:predicted transcriptional regulator
MNQYNLPQEIEVWYVIPAIRRELAKLLTKKYGLSYDKAGEILGITKAAISQYNKNKRASKINLRPNILREIEKSARRMTKDKSITTKEILRILQLMREKRIPFKICKDNFGNGENCEEVALAYEKYRE